MATQDLPIELTIPLPASSTCSGDEEDYEGPAMVGPQTTEEAPIIHEAQGNQDMSTPPAEEFQDGVTGKDVIDVAVTELPAVSLDELAQLIRLQKYQSGHASSVQNTLSRVMFLCGLNRRLIRSTTLAYAAMLDHFKADNQAGFAALFRTCEQMLHKCHEIGHSIPTDTGDRVDHSACMHLPGSSTSSWLQDLPPDQQDDVLKFIMRIRTDPNFLPDRISTLSSAELVALSSPYQSTSVVDSVLENLSHGKGRLPDKASRLGTDPACLDTLRGLHHKDPMFALFYDCFDDSSKPRSSEYLRRIDVWSTTCARTTTLGKRGSDEFLNFALNSFAGLQDWPLKPKVELFLIRVLQQGAFLLDSSASELIDFKQPVEIRKARTAIASSNFFDQALKDLFKLLTGGSARDCIPGSVLDFARGFLSRIKDPRIRIRAKNFIAAKWYFSSFLSNILVYPESQGLMMTHHVGSTARRTILKELVIRMQKQVIDITSPWRKSLLVASDIQACIGQFFQYFDPREHKDPTFSIKQGQREFAANTFKAPLMLSLHSVELLVRTLFPDSPPSSSSTNSIFGKNSSESSVAGSSTLTTGPMEPGSGMVSSTTPSVSGTSMTSTTMLSEGPIVSSQVKEAGFPLAQSFDYTPGLVLRAKEMEEDLGIQLKSVCRKLMERKGFQTSHNDIYSPDEWAFVYISANGEKLSLAPFETAANLHEPSETPGADCNHSTTNQNTDYVFLKDAVFKLMDNQDRLNNLLEVPGVLESGLSENDSLDLRLEDLFLAMMKTCQVNFDFNDAHFWWKSLEALRHFTHTERSPNPCETLLRSIGRDVRTNIMDHARINEQNEKWLRSYRVIQVEQHDMLQRLKVEQSSLRLKMWYVSDVRHSSTYEDALHVTRALRAMASPPRMKQPGSIKNWARHRLRSSTAHDRSEAQALEALSAQKDHGGPHKLADEQIDLTSRWLTRNSVENFCKGEERIHRFCFEIQRCVSKLGGASLLDSPVLWSSRLFEREKLAFDKEEIAEPGDVGSNTSANPWGRGSFLSSQEHGPELIPTTFQNLRTNDITNNISRLWNTPRVGSYETAETDSADFSWVREPARARHLWLDNSSTLLATSQSKKSSDDNMLRKNPSGQIGKAKRTAFISQIKQNLTSLLLSDLGYLLWAQGSETDAWVNLDLPKFLSDPTVLLPTVPQHNNDSMNGGTPIPDTQNTTVLEGHTELDGLRPTDRSSTETVSISGDNPADGQQFGIGICGSSSGSTFPYLEAYKSLLQKLSANPDPHVKLQVLYELEMLVLNSIQQSSISGHRNDSTLGKSNIPVSRNNHLTARTMRMPRTKATSLEEVVANCFERRAGTMKARSSDLIPSPRGLSFYATDTEVPDTDDIVNALLTIFRDSNYRPQTLFRDLQFIAAFIPPEILDQTPKGKAFWDAGLAALALKEDLCKSMIDRANEITTYHISGKNTPGHELSIPQNLVHSSLKDAAELWIIIAKEGSPTAARELGLFYLTHPELLPRVTLPLSKSKDVFKSAMSNERSGNESGALDPLTFAVVFHWMELAANGGDKDAKDFLRGNGELSAVM